MSFFLFFTDSKIQPYTCSYPPVFGTELGYLQLPQNVSR